MKYCFITEIDGEKVVYTSKPEGIECEKVKLIEGEEGKEPDHEELKEYIRQMFKKHYSDDLLDDMKLETHYFAFREHYYNADWSYMKGKKKIPIKKWNVTVANWFAPKLHLLRCYKKQTTYNNQEYHNLR